MSQRIYNRPTSTLLVFRKIKCTTVLSQTQPFHILIVTTQAGFLLSCKFPFPSSLDSASLYYKDTGINVTPNSEEHSLW
jgi:hypothetical protein